MRPLLSAINLIRMFECCSKREKKGVRGKGEGGAGGCRRARGLPDYTRFTITWSAAGVTAKNEPRTVGRRGEEEKIEGEQKKKG